MLAAYREPASTLYSKMLANQRGVAAIQDKQLQSSLAVEDAAFANHLANMTWGEVKGELERDVIEGEAAQRVYAERIKAIQVELGQNTSEIGDAATALAEVRQQLSARSGEERKWRARRVLLMAMLKAAGQTGDDAPKTLESYYDSALKTEIPEFAKNGKAVTVKDILGDELNSFGSSPMTKVLDSITFGAFSPANYPGLNVVSLSLAVDLADARLKRLQLDREIATRKVDVIAASNVPPILAAEALALLKSTINSDQTPTAVKPQLQERTIDTFARAHGPATRTAFQADEEKRETAQVRAAIENLLTVLGKCAAANVDQSALRGRMIDLEMARLDEERSIRLSALNAGEREALVGRQLDALRIYHEGGIRPEDLGNLIGSAQLAAQAFIAGRVK